MAAVPPSAFLERLVELVKQEQQAEEDEAALLFTHAPVSLLERNGLALGNLQGSTSIGLGGRLLVDLTRPSAFHSSSSFPPHDFRPGDLARIRAQGASGDRGGGGGGGKKAGGGKTDKGKGKEAAAGDGGLDAVVYRVNATKIVLAIDADEADEFVLPERIQIVKVANPTTFTRQTHFLNRALRKLDAAEPLNSLLSVLLGMQKLSPPEKQEVEYIDDRLNPTQREAVEFALGSREVALIWGPPGTGKTQTLVEIIRQLVRSDQRVLVCGASNLSVDNILARLSVPHPSFTTPIPLTRLGHPARVLSQLTRHTLDAQSAQTDASALVEDVKSELEALEGQLRNGTGKNRIKGSERKKMWEEVRELRKEMRKRQGGIQTEVLSKAKVVLATTHGAGGRSLDKHDFDVVIIDESAQATEPACWIPIMKGKKLILAGDHLQLPPTLKSSDSSSLAKKKRSASKDKDKDPATSPSDVLPSSSLGKLASTPTLELTLFSRLLALLGPSCRKMLKIQYRFNGKINEFPSKTLYDGELVPDESVAERRLSDLEGVEEDEDLDEAVVFIDTAGQAMHERSAEDGSFGSESKSNENEADIVHKYVQTLITANVPPTSISIISPYNSQVLLLASLIHPQYPEVEIGSVDSNQGRENDVVIVSLVRSNDEGEVGFLRELRRLNVSMTRPRRHLVVVGDSDTVGKGSAFLKKWMAWLEEEALVKVP
ncbi:hypothetical protein JCM8097_005650 [Rhodosporidiobolus ruineniae]